MLEALYELVLFLWTFKHIVSKAHNWFIVSSIKNVDSLSSNVSVLKFKVVKSKEYKKKLTNILTFNYSV